MTFLTRRLLQKVAVPVARSLRTSRGAVSSLSTLSSTRQQDDRHSHMVAAVAVVAAATAAGISWDRKADCCGIAGVVGTPGHDAR